MGPAGAQPFAAVIASARFSGQLWHAVLLLKQWALREYTEYTESITRFCQKYVAPTHDISVSHTL